MRSTLLLLAAIAILLTSCSSNAPEDGGKSTKQEDEQRVNDFSTVAAEQEFWDTWSEEHSPDQWPLARFCIKKLEYLWEKLDARLRTIAEESDTFVVIFRVNENRSEFDAVSLAKGESWQRFTWPSVFAVASESCANVEGIPDDVLRRLSDTPILVVVPTDATIWDDDSVYVFLRYDGKCSRYAVYAPDATLVEGVQPGTVRHSLKLLLQAAGVMRATHPPQ